jgi:hypothetical protein
MSVPAKVTALAEGSDHLFPCFSRADVSFTQGVTARGCRAPMVGGISILRPALLSRAWVIRIRSWSMSSCARA